MDPIPGYPSRVIQFRPELFRNASLKGGKLESYYALIQITFGLTAVIGGGALGWRAHNLSCLWKSCSLLDS
jgi:hypothetical protein